MSEYRYSVRVDRARNVLYLEQEGSAEKVDLLRFREAYVAALADVRPGWVMVHDQRRVESFSDEALEVGKDLVAITNDHRAARVIRIAPEALATRTRVGRVLVAARSKYGTCASTRPRRREELVARHLAAAGAGAA